jgi:hypothetical protein
MDAILGWPLLVLGSLLGLVFSAATLYFGGKVLLKFIWGTILTILMGRRYITYESDQAMLKGEWGWIVDVLIACVGAYLTYLSTQLIDYAGSLVGFPALFESPGGIEALFEALF